MQANTVAPPKTDDPRTLHAQTGNAKAQQISLINDKNGENAIIDSNSLKESETLFIKNCKDSSFTVTGKCTKIFVESVTNTKVVLQGMIITAVVEVWKCDNLTLEIDTKVLTLQADACKGLNITYAAKEQFDRLIWAGVYDLNLQFKDTPEHTNSEGYAQMKEKHKDLTVPLSEQTDQFIVRFVDGKLVSEQIVRLTNGYPTTEREAAAFDAESKRNAEATEAYVRALLDAKSSKLGLKRLQKAKVPRNSPCTCGSGKKFKTCCGKNEP